MARSAHALLIAVLCVFVFAAAWLHAADAPAATPVGPSVLPDTIVTERVSLSYTDPKRCLDMLKVFGYQTCEPGAPVNVAAMPCVIVMPSTTGDGLPDEKKKNFPQTDMDPTTDLLVFYERDKPKQFSCLLERIRKTLDTPARQIMIEALVLEIGSAELTELGVEWELNRGGLSKGNWLAKHSSGAVRFGNIDLLSSAGAIIDPSTALGNVTNIFGQFETRIQALIVSKTARVLSRPSVLTLDNRMASIDVSEKIPVAESKFASNGNFTQVSFRELTAGIQLMVRPRICADGEEIGMQITATVTARKPGGDVIIHATDAGGNSYEVARSPTLTVREVKTFARIANNTPFIIGGLVAQDDNSIRSKVPFLSSIPLIGALFSSKEKINSRREVIIVITPHVLDNDASTVHNFPKDVDDFDSFGAELFRDAYRIRAEDVFNLSFLTENPRLKILQQMADDVVATNAELAKVHPFNEFYQGHFPGEEILVCRQIYEVIKRRGLATEVDEKKLIFLTSEGLDSGMGVNRISSFVRKLAAKESGLHDLCTDDSDDRERKKQKRLNDGEPSKAIAMTFTERKDVEASLADVLLQPVPKIEILDCPDREAWGQKLWQMNQPDPVTGLKRFTVLLRDEGDLLRLKRAIVLRRTVELNASTRQMTLQNFTLGHVLRMPTVKTDKFYLVDRCVAKYFFFTEHYYRAVGYELDKGVAAFDEAMEKLGLEPAADQ
ncbi:MAG: type II secretion system protein GspD [Lentisphaeria bacterium]|nr:type II secretion system protein GspD [Lentisphaeria bacterium]